MKIWVISRDKYLKRKIELELGNEHEVVFDCEGIADALIFDADSQDALPVFDGRIIKLSRSEESDGAYQLPLPLGELKRLISKKDGALPLTVSKNAKMAYLRDKNIKLTTHEHALLSLLISGGGSYVSREKIAKNVWNGASDTLINVYVHYLREKLEADGDKIILSSRKYGYKINEKYITEDAKEAKEC